VSSADEQREERSQRWAGILLHPTSLPGPFGIGDLGPEDWRWLDWLERAGKSVWQVLPLTPTEVDHSPYTSPSAFAGNPPLISSQWLAEDGSLDPAEIAALPAHAAGRVDCAEVERTKLPGVAGGNWSWRAREEDFAEAVAARLRRLVEITDRLPPRAAESSA